MVNINPKSILKPAKGRLLLSNPFLDDPNFTRTVIFLCEHNNQGSFGFVLNQYLEYKLDQIVSEFPHFDTKISIGGPVEKENLFFVHSLGDAIPGGMQVSEKLKMGGNIEALKILLENGDIGQNQIRFFIGYSGWSPNQLEEEMKENSWIISETNHSEIMNTGIDNLWNRVMTNLGGDFKHLTNFPVNPLLN